jgi:hypothetical protein
MIDVDSDTVADVAYVVSVNSEPSQFACGTMDDVVEFEWKSNGTLATCTADGSWDNTNIQRNDLVCVTS